MKKFWPMTDAERADMNRRVEEIVKGQEVERQSGWSQSSTPPRLVSLKTLHFRMGP